MTLVKHPKNSTGASRQKGIATILIVLLMGIALTATSMGIIHSVRSTQEKQVAVHAATNAQTGVWAGAEAFRRYLGSLEIADLDALMSSSESVEYPIAFGASGDLYGSLTAKNVSATVDGDIYRVSAKIINIHEAAKSSSALSVMYEINPSDGCNDCVELSNSLDFYEDLLVTGGIHMLAPEGSKANLNVAGELKIENIDITGMGRLSVMKDVFLNSQVEAEYIHSNQDVTITGGAKIGTVRAMGTVTTSGGSGASRIWANGTVALGGSFRALEAHSLSPITVTSEGHGLLTADGDITFSQGGTLPFGAVMSTKDINVDSWVVIGDIVGNGSLTCPGSSWQDVTSISVKDELKSCNEDFVANGTAVIQPNTIPIMEPVQPFEMPPIVVDVWPLKPMANYILEWEPSLGRTKVTVQNVNNLDDGIYYIGDYDGSRKNYLCTAFEPSKNNKQGACTAPTVSTIPICMGWSLETPCLSYDASTKTWEFDGTATVPGIIWVDGDLKLGGGKNYSTFLVTGSITTGSDLTVRSVNYGGFDEVCQATGAAIPNDENKLRDKYQALFKTYYPTNLCSMVTDEEGTYNPISTGNIALAAGGVSPTGNNAFSGGNIQLGSLNVIYGSVLAGNYLQTSGDTTVHGYVVGASQAGGTLGTGSNARKNLIGASTTIDLRDLPEGYDPTQIPDMGAPCITGCDGAGGNGEKSRLLWSRYL